MTTPPDAPPAPAPVALGGARLALAEATGMTDPNAIALATLDEQGQPQARIVLLKEWDAAGFVFYTNYTSTKGRALLHHPQAGFNLFWRELGRQIRVEGAIAPVSPERSDAYFATRPRGSQIGAWASQQSQPVASYQTLLDQVAAVEARFHDQPVPRPPHWGGFCLVPSRIEFWHAGQYRLHDRWEFTRPSPDAPWTATRLSP
jgi:pyridoxamine 5'-phosphate oxidase